MADEETATTTEEQPAGGEEQVPAPGEEQPGGEEAAGEEQEAGGEEAGGEKGDEGATGAYEDFEMPEGVELDNATLEQAVPIFEELNLSQEQAQKLVDFHASQIKGAQEQQAESFNQLTQDWLEQAQNDEEIGGDKFDENVSDARIGLEQLGTPELKQLFNETGVGNHPEVIRAFARIGKLVKEDSPGAGGNPPGKQPDRVEQLYGDS